MLKNSSAGAIIKSNEGRDCRIWKYDNFNPYKSGDLKNFKIRINEFKEDPDNECHVLKQEQCVSFIKQQSIYI